MRHVTQQIKLRVGGARGAQTLRMDPRAGSPESESELVEG